MRRYPGSGLSLSLPISLLLATLACGGGTSNSNNNGDGNGGGGTTTPPAITITISPTSTTVTAGGTQQFQATVTGSRGQFADGDHFQQRPLHRSLHHHGSAGDGDSSVAGRHDEEGKCGGHR